MAVSAAVRKTIKNMLGGVSQQPPLQRLESQCEEMINCVPSLTEFLKRRNGTRFISELVGSVDDSAFIGFIERGDNEAGIVTVDKLGNVMVYNLDGKKLGQAQCGYLISGNPKDDIKLCTVRDYNFLLNTKRNATAESISTPPKNKKNIVFIKQAAYDQQYTVNIGGKEFTYTTPKTDNNGTYKLSVETIAKGLVKLMTSQNTNTDYKNAYRCRGDVPLDFNGGGHISIYNPPPHTVYDETDLRGRSCLTCVKGDQDGMAEGNVYPVSATCLSRLDFIGYYWESDKQIHENPPAKAVSISAVYTDKGIIVIETSEEVSSYDGYAGSLLTVFKDKCYAVSDLPVNAPEGFILEVIGDTVTNTDNYYIQFETEDKLPAGKIGRGGWKEIAKQGQGTGFINSTLPYVLKINPDNIVVETIQWNKRQAGDIDTNSLPSFANKTIKDIFFYKNRLGFITDDTVVLSEAGGYFNFFQTTVLALLDSDPIDVAISGTKVSALKFVVPYAEALFIYTDRSIYALEYGEVLSTASVELKPVLQFDTSLRAKPCVCDTSIYYAGRNGAYNQVREYNPTEKTDQYGYSNDITSHIPKYISGDINGMLVSLEDGIMFLINSTDTVYCYSFIKDSGELLLSSWHKWKFTYPVIAGTLFQGWLYLVFKKPDNNLYLGKLAVSAADNLYKDETAKNSLVNYISSYTYSTYYLRDGNGRVQDISTMIRTMSLKYSAGSDFKLIIDRKGRKQETRLADKKRDFTRFLAAGENKNITVRIESIEDKPFNIIETDLEVVYASRS